MPLSRVSELQIAREVQKREAWINNVVRILGMTESQARNKLHEIELANMGIPNKRISK